MFKTFFGPPGIFIVVKYLQQYFSGKTDIYVEMVAIG